MKMRLIAIKRGLLVIAGFVLFVGVFALSPVWAMTSRSGEQVAIGASEVIGDDLYVAGNTITIDGTVKGDVIGAGRQITVNGTIEGDLIAAGQAVVINGTVKDDVRVAGQVLVLEKNARIADDVVAAGFSLESKTGSSVGGGLSFAGAQALLAGTVKQDVTGGMAALELRGTVGRNVSVTVADKNEPFNPPIAPQPPVPVPQVPAGLTLADSAQIGGELIYKSPSEADISAGAKVASPPIREQVEYRQYRRESPTAAVPNNLGRLVTLLLVGLLLLWAVPVTTQSLANTVESKPLPSLSWGFVALLAVAVLAVAIPTVTFILTAVFALTVGGLVPLILGFGVLAHITLLTGFLLFTGYVPPIVLSLLGGRRLLRAIQPTREYSPIAPLAVGLLLFVLLTAIPGLGGLINLTVILLGLGAIWQWGQTKLRFAPALSGQADQP